MKKSNQAFSIVEIIVSISILTIGVFWVYALIGKNMSLLWDTQKITLMKTLQKNFKECVEYFWFDGLNSYDTGSEFSIHFWDDYTWCFTGSFNKNYIFTWVLMDNEEYFLYGEIIKKDSDSLHIHHNVFSPSIWKLYKIENHDDVFQNIIIKNNN